MHLSPYEILAPLGAGGMGEVYRAKDTRLDRTVAMKVLPPHVVDNAAARLRLERERFRACESSPRELADKHGMPHPAAIASLSFTNKVSAGRAAF